MPRFVQPTFAAGELAPELHGRVDTFKYNSGLARARNAFIHNYGGVSNRAGLRYLGPVCAGSMAGRDPTVRLIPFVFNSQDSYILEFGNTYVKVIRNRGYVFDSIVTNMTSTTQNRIVKTSHGFSNGNEVRLSNFTGTLAGLNGKRAAISEATSGTFKLLDPYTSELFTFPAYGTGSGRAERIYRLNSPYLSRDLFELRYVQQGDVMTITHPEYQPKELTRINHAFWTLENIPYKLLPIGPGSFSAALTEAADPDITIIAPSSVAVREDHDAIIRIRLSHDPQSEVSVAINPFDSGKIIINPSTLFFSPDNGTVNQDFTVQALEDDDGLLTTDAITLTATGGSDDVHNISVEIIDTIDRNDPFLNTPATPGTPVLRSRTTTELNVGTTPVPGARSYVWRVSTDNILTSGDTTSITDDPVLSITGLSDGDARYVAVAARNDTGVGLYSAAARFTTGAPQNAKPDTPAKPELSRKTDDELQFTTMAVARATSYVWRVSTDSTVNSSDTTMETTEAGLLLEGLDAGTTRWVSVAAKNTGGTSTFSPVTSGTTSAVVSVPTVPQNPMLSETGNSVTITVDVGVAGRYLYVDLDGDHAISSGPGARTVSFTVTGDTLRYRLAYTTDADADPDSPPAGPWTDWLMWTRPSALRDALAAGGSIDAPSGGVDEGQTHDFTISFTGGRYDEATTAWNVVSGGGTFDGNTYTAPIVASDTEVLIRAVTTFTGMGINARDNTSDMATLNLIFTVNNTTSLPAAAAPTLSIGGDQPTTASLNANTTVSATATGGTYDTITWSSSTSGASTSATGNQRITFTKASAGDVTITFNVTVRGTGTNAAAGTMATATITHTVTFAGLSAQYGTYISARDFDLDSENTSSEGISIENGFAYVVDTSDAKVYAYELSTTGAVYRSARDFSRSGGGLAVANGFAYVVTSGGDKVFVHELSSTGATYRSARDFNLAAGNDSPTGISIENGFAYVADADNTVYAYELSTTGATYRNTRNFSLTARNRNARGISVANGFAYVVDRLGNKVYAYELSTTGAVYHSARDFNLTASNSSSVGIATASGFAYVVDSIDNKVYVYQIT